MARKDLTLVYVAGAAGLAYLILRKPSTPTAPAQMPAPSTIIPKDILSEGASFITSLFNKPAQGSSSPALPAPAPVSMAPVSSSPDVPGSIQVLPGAGLPQILPDPGNVNTIDQLYAYDQESLAGFTELPGTALAVMCGMGCAACAMPGAGLAGTKFDWKSLIVPGFVIAGGYVLLKNLGLFGGASTTNNAQIAQQTSTANQTGLTQALNNGSQKTMSDAQYNSLATDIFNQGLSLFGGLSSRAMDQIVQDFSKINSTADLYALKIAFGVKQASSSFWSTCNWLNFNCTAYDLDSFVKANLDSDHISQINNYFQARGINYSL